MSAKTTGTENKPQTDDPNAGKSQAQLDKEAIDKASGKDQKDTINKVAELEKIEDKAQEVADSAASQADAAKKGQSVAGSPVTNGTKASTDASGAAKATEGNFSPTTVAPGMTAAVDDKGDGDPVRDPEAAKERAEKVEETNNKIDGVDHGDPETVSDDLADELDAATGKTTSDNDDVTKAASLKTPKVHTGGAPTGSGQDQQDAKVDDTDAEDNTGDAVQNQEARGAAVRVKRLVDLLDGKKGEFTIYGYGGVEVKLGDLRHLIASRSL